MENINESRSGALRSNEECFSERGGISLNNEFINSGEGWGVLSSAIACSLAFGVITHFAVNNLFNGN